MEGKKMVGRRIVRREPDIQIEQPTVIATEAQPDIPQKEIMPQEQPAQAPIKKRRGRKPRKLTIKDRKFIKEYAKTGNATEAEARISPGITRPSASELGSRRLRRVEQYTGLRAAMEAAGLTDEYIAKGLYEGTKANEVKIATEKGQITDEREYADMPTRKTYYELVNKLRGDLKEDVKTVRVSWDAAMDEREQAKKKEHMAKNIIKAVEGALKGITGEEDIPDNGDAMIEPPPASAVVTRGRILKDTGDDDLY